MAENLNIFSNFVPLASLVGGRNNLNQLVSAKTAPTILNVSPVAGTVINANQEIAFDVTVADDQGFASVIVWVEYPDLKVTEVVYNGLEFAYNFTGSIQTITLGKRFTYRRTGGFPAAPIMKIQVTTNSGGTN